MALGRRAILAIVLLTAGVAAGLRGSRALRTRKSRPAPRCANEPATALGCFDRHFRTIVDRQGVAEAFADLKAGYAADPDLQRLCHAVTHAIGQAAMARYGDVAAAFRYGDNACGSGYYHGVLQGFALSLGREKLLSDLEDRKSV